MEDICRGTIDPSSHNTAIEVHEVREVHEVYEVHDGSQIGWTQLNSS